MTRHALTLAALVTCALPAAAAAYPVAAPPLAARLAQQTRLAGKPVSYSWRYYRPSNTGIQGDYCDALWVGPDGDPYVGGYQPSFEEGGFAKLVQAENRWINYSNVDHPVIGDPDVLGSVRVQDIVADASGKLWMGTWVGALEFDPAVGAASIVARGPSNSALAGGRTYDIDLAPDGTLWFAADGGIVRYDPASDAWTSWPLGNVLVAAQPKALGGYWILTADAYFGSVQRFDSATQAWTTLPSTGLVGQMAGLPGKDCVDDAGNLWALRLAQPGELETLDYRTPSGQWVAPAQPYPGSTFDIWAFKAYGNARALVADGNGFVWRFDGASWQNLGQWRPGGFTYALGVDAAGNAWVSGVGGAAKHDALTGEWQRYRVTNTSQFDFFNEDLALDERTGHVYAGANAGSGIGGMTRFDGTRWTCWNSATYGLGWSWPFNNDNCHALAYRPSNGFMAVSPLDWLYGIHEWTGAGFDTLLASGGAERMCEDSLGRLWALGEYYSLQVLEGSTWTEVGITAWGSKIQRDPERPGTVWAATGHEVTRTDGVYRFSRFLEDFPELTAQSDTFSGLAAAPGGIAWVGATVQFGAGGTGGALIRIDSNDGSYEMLRHDQGWPLPGQFVQPLAVTPDGRVWMQYDSDYLTAQRGLCWYDGRNVGVFPAPPFGGPQWGGLPHAAIADLEVRPSVRGYELWMSCLSRGIAVLTVRYPKSRF